MKVLLVGSGGREHALAWKLSQSPLLTELFILPGNPGTARLGTNLPGDPLDIPLLVEQAKRCAVDLVFVGPEAPLDAGLIDALGAAGIPAFGPSRAAAQIEASKAFAREFMQRHGIPGPSFRAFKDYGTAWDYVSRLPASALVIKASGLASGKGVYLPEDSEQARQILHDLLVSGELGVAGSQVVIEERLQGPEVSVLVFTDGRSVLLMPPAQDHKRLLDGDRGPNTGGMGAFAPSPLCPDALLRRVAAEILQPAVDGLRQEGIPFVGVLYAGLMLTSAGPRVLEFNCRFGDPETQAILPLLESDLLEIASACVQGRLAEIAPEVRWKAGAAAVVVLASQGYPGKITSGAPVMGLEEIPEGVWFFQAGTALEDDRLVTSGGRVLGISAYGDSLGAAIETAYQSTARVHFEGMVYRKDIGRGIAQAGAGEDSPTALRAYESAGVSIEAGNLAVEKMRNSVSSTYGPEVLSGVGGFGGLYHAAGLMKMKDPVLVATTDGVGTKVILAARTGRIAAIGHDIVNHCINDLLVQGGRPLFFLDYYASSRLEPDKVAEIVAGMSEACREVGCALIGGETAEMPGVYAEGHFDVAGMMVGVVERAAVLPRLDIHPGDLLLGIASSGPHTNGYSLIRKVVDGVNMDGIHLEPGRSLADALLAPHRAYLKMLSPFLESERSPIKALAHITGGGFIDNLPRVLPAGCGARVMRDSWTVPPVFRWIQQRGMVEEVEMYRVFNMGIGMVAVVAREHLYTFQAGIPEMTWVIGEVISGREVELV